MDFNIPYKLLILSVLNDDLFCSQLFTTTIYYLHYIHTVCF